MFLILGEAVLGDAGYEGVEVQARDVGVQSGEVGGQAVEEHL